MITISQKDIEIVSKHDEIVKETQKEMKRIVNVGLYISFNSSMTNTVIVLYAATFYDDSTIIGIIVYVACLDGAINTLFSNVLGDFYGFDTILCICACLDAIFFFGEAAAFDFIFFSVCYVLGGFTGPELVGAYLAKMLPTVDSKQLNATFWQYFGIAYILGPVSGGKPYVF